MQKSELLLPAGNPECFRAALEGGADAVYLGLKRFNARGRASNFTLKQLQALLPEAHKNNTKVYLTLNTVIKNEELTELLDFLFQVDQLGIDAIIIQDLGVYYFIRKFFPNLTIHASTQMAIHNSNGANFAQKSGFDRVVMARELTWDELCAIRNNSPVELEVFTHGALCYSFSGMCLFSSYLGGMGANRGMCTQPCRRVFESGKKKAYTFSLKDNQLIEKIPAMAKLPVESFKIEGRMKSADYVYQVARAYRLAMDEGKTKEAKAMLTYDMGREKTDYFMGRSVAKAITVHPNTGILLGRVTQIGQDWIKFESHEQLEVGNRLRIRDNRGEERTSVKIAELSIEGNECKVTIPSKGIRKGDSVFLAGIRFKRFSNKVETLGKPIKMQAPHGLRKKAISALRAEKAPRTESMFVRIDSLAWLRKIHFESIDGLMLNLTRSEWQEFRFDAPFIQKNSKKIWIELPKFVPEKQLDFYRKLCGNLSKSGFRQFFISHLSQAHLLPKNAVFATNEQVYVYNDAAAMAVRESGARFFTYPLENDAENLYAGKERGGMVTIYGMPHLFFSRMPVKVNGAEDTLIDDKGGLFRREVRDGLTYLLPTVPFSLLQYSNELKRAGFKRFLIDLSFEKPSKNLLNKLMGRFKRNEQVQPSSNFNFKKGLK